MVTIGIGFFFRGKDAFDDPMLGVFLFALGIASILMGTFVLVGKRSPKEENHNTRTN